MNGKMKGLLEIGMETGIYQGIVACLILTITFQIAMLQVPDEEVRLMVTRSLGQGLMGDHMNLGTKLQDVTVTHHIHPIVDDEI